MKAVLIFLWMGTCSVWATEIYAQNSTIHIKGYQNITIGEFIQEVESQTDYLFVYSKSEVNTNAKVPLPGTETSVKQALQATFENSEVNFLFDNDYIILTKKVLAPVASAQPAITGKVVDETGETLPGVNVVVKGTTTGVITDHEGRYHIKVPSREAVLIFSFMGYATQEVVVDTKDVINLVLKEETKLIDEVVVVGYGTQKKVNMTGSIASLSAEDTRDKPVSQFSQALQGKISGVQISQANGRPGEGMTFRIRGAGTLSGSNSPLFVVDGLPLTGEVNNISPDEIESYTVLKDASATALYGSRAANGVILITTRKGKAGRTDINFTANYGLQTVPKKGRPDLMNGTEYATWKKNYYEDMFPYTGEAVPEIYRNPEQYGEGTDWFDHIIRVAPIQNYSISVLSGTEKLKVSAVAAYMNQQGVLLNTEFQRFNFRLNTEYKLNDHISFGANLAPSHRKQENHADGGWDIIGCAVLAPPIVPFQNEDGSYPEKIQVPGSIQQPHPYIMLTERVNQFKGTRLLGNAYVELSFLQNFKFKSALSIDTESATHQIFTPKEAAGSMMTIGTKSTGTYNTGVYTSWLLENTLNYVKSFGKNNLEVLAGTTAQKYHWEGSGIDGEYFANNYPWLTQAQITRLGGYDANAPQEWSLLSYLARVNYNFDGKYLFQASIRQDGCSRFGQDNRWGTFPSVSAGWILSEEKFMKHQNVLNYLKLRTSYGITGDNNIGNYTYYASIAGANYVLGDIIHSGSYLSNLENRKLGWETSTQFDLGLDIGFLNDRIYLQTDYWVKYTRDMLFDLDLPNSSGYGNIKSNVGEIKFWGFDFDIDSKNLVGEFKWNTNLNLSFSRNKVMELGPNAQHLGADGDYSGGGWHRTEVGKPIGYFYGYKYDGVYMNQAELDAGPRYADSDAGRASIVGSPRMADTNGDDIITRDDRTMIGNPHPDCLFGITNEFRYKNWDMNFVISGSIGNDIAMNFMEYTYNLDGAFNMDKRLINTWRSEANPGDGTISRAAGPAGTTHLARDRTSLFVADGSYLSMKYITLGYSFTSAYFKSLRIYVSCQNLFTWTNYPGANPEVSQRGGNTRTLGIDDSAYPATRVFSIGANLSF